MSPLTVVALMSKAASAWSAPAPGSSSDTVSPEVDERSSQTPVPVGTPT